MSLWIKICGNTSLDDALMAVEAGADALGFVFAPSPRHVTAAEVAGIVSRLPAAIEKIGVFVDASLSEIYATVRECGLTGVQLHFDANPNLPGKLRARLAPELREKVMQREKKSASAKKSLDKPVPARKSSSARVTRTKRTGKKKVK